MPSNLFERIRSIYELDDHRRRFHALEGVRGFAVLLVFFVHYHSLFSDYLPAASTLRSVSAATARIGDSGVDLFFVLSGFLIYGSLARRERTYSQFIRRRIRRIYPTFGAVFAAYIALSLVFPSRSKIPGDPFDASFFLATNFLLLPGMLPLPLLITVAWSLSYELFYYLTIPLAVSGLRLREWKGTSRPRLFCGALLAFLGFSLWWTPDWVRLSFFLVGMILYERQDSPRWRNPVIPAVTALAVGAGTFVSFFPIDFSLIAESARIPTDNAGLVFRRAGLCLAFYFLVGGATRPEGLLSRAFSWQPLRWLGNISYSYYLIHGLTLHGIQAVLFRLLPPTGAQSHVFLSLFPFAVTATLISSTLLFCWVEKPYSLRR